MMTMMSNIRKNKNKNSITANANTATKQEEHNNNDDDDTKVNDDDSENEEDEDEDEDEDDEDGSENDENNASNGRGNRRRRGRENDKVSQEKKTFLESVYDPRKYDSLNVAPEVKNLFSFITYYTPQTVEIGTKLKPFIPDYIPAVGDVDAFIKIPLPDDTKMEEEHKLGLTVLDEPSLQQSDPSLLQLKLRAFIKDTTNATLDGDTISGGGGSGGGGTLKTSVVRSSGSAKEIDTWIENIKNLHESTIRPDSMTLLPGGGVGGGGTGSGTGKSSVSTTKISGDIEELMQEWPEEMETMLNIHSLPSAELDCTLEEYIGILCAILDIPVQSNKIASLHQMFTLYNEFKNSQHFNKR